VPLDALERRLLDLARQIEYPPAPDAAGLVLRALAGSDDRRPPAVRRPTVLSAACLAMALSAALAVPQARTAAFRVLHLGGVSVERVTALPVVQRRSSLPPGRPVTFDDARRAVSFAIILPRGLGRPDAVYLSEFSPGGYVTLLYGAPRRPRLLLSEFVGRSPAAALVKKVTAATAVESVKIDGRPGIWLGPGTHLYSFVDEVGVSRQSRTYLAGNTLVWEQGPVTLRLEAAISKEAALEIAKSVG
jgi:hypothetical protein